MLNFYIITEDAMMNLKGNLLACVQSSCIESVLQSINPARYLGLDKRSENRVLDKMHVQEVMRLATTVKRHVIRVPPRI